MITYLVPAADGVTVALHRVDAAAQRTPPLLLVHGAFSSHTVWLRGGAQGHGLARFFAARGHDVWLGEWRPHGAAAPEGARPEPSPESWPSALPVSVLGPLRRAFALATIAICRTMGRFPSRALRFGSEDEAALVLAEWMAWNVRGRWTGRDGFDYLAALARMRAPFLAVAGAGDRLFAPAAACRMLYESAGTEAKQFAVVGPRGLSHRGLVLDARADEQCWPLVADWIARLPVPAPHIRIAL